MLDNVQQFLPDVDYDIVDNCNSEQLAEYIRSNFISPSIDVPGYKFKRRVKVMQVLCKLLNLEPSMEQWVFLLSDCERLLCEAAAGSGKTTMAQLKLIDEKLTHNVPGENILALAYNNHAVKSMIGKHYDIITEINNSNVKELRRDTNICCYTFHSFCKGWVEDYLQELGYNSENKRYLITDVEQFKLVKFALEAFKKKKIQTDKRAEKLFISDTTIHDFIALYAFSCETLSKGEPDKWKLCTSYDSLLTNYWTSEYLLECIKNYEKLKKLKQRMDFNDLISNMYALCCKPEVIKRIRANYKVFLVDEYQDITPSMLEVLKLILEGNSELGIKPYYDAKLICIGDGDQSIYGFRGTDPDNCIRFKPLFGQNAAMTRITTMSVNRRCPREICEKAASIILSNEKRIQKPIRSLSEGGKVETVSYEDPCVEIDNIISKLKALQSVELNDTCICYRNLSSSCMLTLKLLENGIPFRIGSGNAPLSDILSTTLIDTCDMLSYPDSPLYMKKVLYKLLPKSYTFSRKSLDAVLTNVEERYKKGELVAFYDIEFPDAALAINGFSNAISMLKHCRMCHRNNKPMNTYIPKLINLIHKYYLDFQMAKREIIPDSYMHYIEDWFSRGISYADFHKEYVKLIDAMKDSLSGAYITTFHGLKGLEFTNVFVIDLDDGIFPGTELAMSRELSPQQLDGLEAEAKRLFYVTVTRAKKNLYLYYSETCPCRYMRFYTLNHKDVLRDAGENDLSYSGAMVGNYGEIGGGFAVVQNTKQTAVTNIFNQKSEFSTVNLPDSSISVCKDAPSVIESNVDLNMITGNTGDTELFDIDFEVNFSEECNNDSDDDESYIDHLLAHDTAYKTPSYESLECKTMAVQEVLEPEQMKQIRDKPEVISVLADLLQRKG